MSSLSPCAIPSTVARTAGSHLVNKREKQANWLNGMVEGTYFKCMMLTAGHTIIISEIRILNFLDSIL